jgi:hypothetical protein
MRAENGCSRTVKKNVSTWIERLTVQGRGNSPFKASYLRRTLRRRRLGWLTKNNILDALTQAWSAATISVVLLSAAVSLAPMWDRAIFVKSLLEALNTNPEMVQLAFAVTDAGPAGQGSSEQSSLNNSDGEGH